MANNGNGTNGASRLLTLNDVDRNAKDAQGRLYRHNCTVMEAHQIAVEEAQKVHEFYLRQIPQFVAQMTHDALVGYGLIQPVVAPPDKESERPSSEIETQPSALRPLGNNAQTDTPPPAESA